MMLRSLILILAILPTFAAENIKAVGAVAKANVKAIGAVAEANIKAFGAVDNTASGGAPEPDDISGLAMWWKADAIGGLSDGDPVSTWADSSGNSRDLTQTGTARPTYKTGILNSLPVVRFDASDDFLTRTETLSFTAAEVFIVFKVDNDPPAGIAQTGLWNFSDDGALNGHYPYFDGTFYDAFGSTARKTLGDLTPDLSTVFRLYNVSTASGAWTARLDGTQVHTDGNTVGWPSTAYVVGRSRDATYFFDGDIAEIVIYSAVLSAGDRDDLEAYFDTKYNLSY